MHAHPFLHDMKTLHPRLKLSLRHCPKKNPGYIIYGCMDRPFARSNFNVVLAPEPGTPALTSSGRHAGPRSTRLAFAVP
ncbi:hypothetical protein CGMCC3_g7504 [Colletotrichum fructicola]|nr:uncharacterized protein CGMCC3_g7504 [Colletotrichum fructicola]KAE9576532.1 hypothetical protein CGMCC3_g7504 [Colletotrichum fructicola]